MIELSERTFSIWRGMFEGQENWVRSLVSDKAQQIAAIPEDAIWNGWLESGDAELYFALVLTLKPARILELGCGFSSSFAARALAENGQGELTCIDPSPRVQLPESAMHLQCPWQEVDRRIFSQLAAGDILFIDSSHSAEEALALYLVLDALAPGVLVHIHDILYPNPPSFPEENLVISYTTLRHRAWRGKASLSLLHSQMGSRFVELFPSSQRAPWRSPGSTWLEKTSP